MRPGTGFYAGWPGIRSAGQYLNTFPTLQTVPVDGAFTLSAWINPRDISQVHTIISQVGGQLDAGEFALRVHGGGYLQLYRRPSQSNESVDVVQSAAIIPLNQWTHVVAVYGSSGGGGNLRLYVNGELVAEDVFLSAYAPTSPRPDTDLNMTRIGASELTSEGNRRYPFNGSIDEVMIFDRALSSDEIRAMYQNFTQYRP